MYGSLDVARAAIQVALTSTRQSEENMIAKLGERGLRAAAVDIGGNISETVHVVIERAIIASRKCHITEENHIHDGAIAGAAKDAIMQISARVNGLNGGGKIGICRGGVNSVTMFFSQSGGE